MQRRFLRKRGAAGKALLICALIRRCGNYPGLDDTWYRTAVRTRRENDALLAALREVLA